MVLGVCLGRIYRAWGRSFMVGVPNGKCLRHWCCKKID